MTDISAENARVVERQVTIKVLTIGTKQVTQALYKQIPRVDLIDERTGELRGRSGEQ